MKRLPGFLQNSIFSPGFVVLTCVCAASTAYILLRPGADVEGLGFWTSARQHETAYQPLIEAWNVRHPESPIHLSLIDYQALERRMLSGFLSGTPLADLIEAETQIAGRAFGGPLEAVGFMDLTDRLRQEGLLEQINGPSFSPWTSRGRIFGLPHDVHPVLLAYRADLAEDAGIDMSRIETWDDFARVCRPVMKDLDGDGRMDRYLINFWHTNTRYAEIFLLQAGGSFFTDEGALCLDSEINARILAELSIWLGGAGRIAIDAPDMTAAGNRLLIEGQVFATLVPDWLVAVWKRDLPELAGKMRLMPLPAWEPGGRRTSVFGGTMIGIPKSSEHREAAWDFARELYLSPKLAESLYAELNIISPVKSFWAESFYDRPDPFFGGQPVGRLYIRQAGDVPLRRSSPFLPMVRGEIGTLLFEARQAVEHMNTTDPEAILPLVRQRLREAHERIDRRIQRNVFLGTRAEGSGS